MKPNDIANDHCSTGAIINKIKPNDTTDNYPEFCLSGGKLETLEVGTAHNSSDEEDQLIESDEDNVACSGTWNKVFKRLEEFRAQHGHCRVPFRYKNDSQLGAWVAVQRRNYKLLNCGRRKKTSLSIEKQKRLQEIGFEWSVEITWEDRFVQLLEFVILNGHAQVPMKWKQNSKLSNWVSAQRREYKTFKMGQPSTINESKIELLNNVGFIWQAERGRSKKRSREEQNLCNASVSSHVLIAKSLLRTIHQNNGNNPNVAIEEALQPQSNPSNVALALSREGNKKLKHEAAKVENISRESGDRMQKKEPLLVSNDAGEVEILNEEDKAVDFAGIISRLQPNSNGAAASSISPEYFSLIQQQQHILMNANNFLPVQPLDALLKTANQRVGHFPTATTGTTSIDVLQSILGISPIGMLQQTAALPRSPCPNTISAGTSPNSIILNNQMMLTTGLNWPFLASIPMQQNIFHRGLVDALPGSKGQNRNVA